MSAVHDAIEAQGYCSRSTPVDTLMAAPVAVGMAVFEAMESHHDGGDHDIPDGFHEADLFGELFEAHQHELNLF